MKYALAALGSSPSEANLKTVATWSETSSRIPM